MMMVFMMVIMVIIMMIDATYRFIVDDHDHGDYHDD